MGQIGRYQSQRATDKAAMLLDRHGAQALDIANAALSQAVRSADEPEIALLCEACLILLRLRSWPAQASAAGNG